MAATAESSQGVLHIEERDGIPQLFVPRNSRDRNLCFSGQLPKSLARYLGITDPAAAERFRVIVLSSADVIDDVLDEDGIIRAPDIDFSSSESNTLGEESDELNTDVSIMTPTSSEDRASATHQLRPGAPRPIPANVLNLPARANFPQIGAPLVVPRATHEPRPLALAEDGRPDFHPSSHSDPEIATPLSSTTQYVQVLEKVIEKGRREVFPSAEAPGLQNRAENLPFANGDVTHGSPFGPRSQNRIEHDIKIGAAGELYVSLCKPPPYLHLISSVPLPFYPFSLSKI